MGCFNGSCIFTGLPIHEGERTGLILLAESFRGHGPSTDYYGGNTLFYPTDLWMPMYLPIYGKYDDYGKLEDIEPSPAGDYILRSFQKRLEDGDFTWRKKKAERRSTKSKVEDLYDIIEIVQSDDLAAYPARGIGYAMFRPEWWKTMTAVGFEDSFHWDKYKTSYVEQFTKEADEWIEVVREKKEAAVGDPLLRSGAVFHLLNDWKRDNVFLAHFANMENNSLKFNYIQPLVQEDLTPKGDDPEWVANRAGLAELAVVSRAMSSLVKLWLPFQGAGQCHCPVDANILYAKELLKTAKAIEKEMAKRAEE